MSSTSIIADYLVSAHRARRRFTPFSFPTGTDRLSAAYDVQDAYVDRLIEGGAGAVAGYKVGLTSVPMQRMCNLDQPVSGRVLASRVHQSGCALRLSDYGRLGLEFEIGLRLGRDLEPSGGAFDRSNVAAAVREICPAIEVVDDRDADYRTLNAQSLIADNSWNGGAILGRFRAPSADLAKVLGIVECNGEPIDRGHGRDVLGHPFESVAWLANHLSTRGERLRKGDFVLTGSLCTTRFPKGGEQYRFSLKNVGTVSVSVED